ncbi:MAG: shikimate kinase [Ottowia sp.]|uniref:shikimate kinase n=1 Tax=Ottowia sp. TaxID=1898956 RepID=UPI0039E333F0
MTAAACEPDEYAPAGAGMRPGSQLAHLVGPGGAGKTTVGALLAGRLGWDFIDLDQAFLAQHGHIATFIDTQGYEAYARHNVALYARIRRALRRPGVAALSSGFMTYPAAIGGGYAEHRAAIEAAAHTVLLLPSLDVERCVDVLVARQLSRPYLDGDRGQHERRVRERMPAFLALRCARHVGTEAPQCIATAAKARTTATKSSVTGHRFLVKSRSSAF